MHTQVFGPSKLSGPSLIIYAPVRVIGTEVIVTNGDQTDTVHGFLRRGETFEDTLRGHTSESDESNFTLRVSGWTNTSTDFAYHLSILKSAGSNPSSVQRMLFEYETSVPGQGYLIHTYRCDDSPVPSLKGESVCVSAPQEPEEFTQLAWNSLNVEDQVLLSTRRTRPSNGETEIRIINKNR